MKVVIVNCFDTYEERINLLYKYFSDKGHDVNIIESDFRHFKKVKRKETKKDLILIESKPYYKNISVSRLKSHYHFAKKAFKKVEDLKPDLLYVTLPPNTLAKFAAKYKKRHSDVKLLFDIIDLWPENMPVRKMKKLPPFILWRKFRDTNIKFADYVITECNLYKSILTDHLSGVKTKTIYLARKKQELSNRFLFDKNNTHLCYLGSINNMIDIPMIVKLINSINKEKPVVLHVIGDGENKDMLLKEVMNTGAKVKYYGNIFEKQEKFKILEKCQFGINIMKDTVCVGLTMKSIDYFEVGLPILNNIKEDTSQFVDHYKAGFNVQEYDTQKLANLIKNMSEVDIYQMKVASRSVFEENLTEEIFFEKLDNCFENILK